MNADIYERHRQAVEKWRSACMTVAAAEHDRNEARAELDKASDDLLASCANSKPAKQIGIRGRRPKLDKANGLTAGVDFKQMMREEPIPGYLPK